MRTAMKRACAVLPIFVLTLWFIRPAKAQREGAPEHDQGLKWTPRRPELFPRLRTNAQTPPAIVLSPTTWTPIGPAPLNSVDITYNVSGRIVAIAADPANANKIYIAAAGGGVWRTSDGGNTWTPLTDTQSTLSMGALALAHTNPLMLYAGTGEANNGLDSNFGRGIMTSIDGGDTWTLRTGPAGVFDRMTISQIVVDPTNANIAYASFSDGGTNSLCCSNTGVWKTSDGGQTWSNLTAAIDTTHTWSGVQIDPAHPNVLYAALGDSSTNVTNGVYKSTNGGLTWTLLVSAPNGLNVDVGRIVLAVAPSNSQVVYVSEANIAGMLQALVRSSNGGTTFSDLTVNAPNYLGSQGWYDMTVIVDRNNASIVYVGGSASANSIMQSPDSGVTWNDLSTGIAIAGVSNPASPHVDHHGIDFDANGKLLDGDDGGIYRLDQPGVPFWTNLNGNLNTIQFQGINLHPTDPTIVIGGSQDNGTDLFSAGAWSETDGGDGGFAKFSKTNPQRVYHQIPNGSFARQFFRRSDDGGNTWNTKVTSLVDDATKQNFYAPFAVDPGNGDRVLYGTNRIWESTNAGDAWTAISTVGSAGWTPAGHFVDSIGLAASDPNTIYASVFGSIFVTTNHGTTWTKVNLPAPLANTYTVQDIQVDPQHSLTAYVALSGFTGAGNVFVTTNGGTTWRSMSGNLPDLPAWSLQIDPTAPGTFYVGMDDGVYVTTNTGVTWSRMGAGLPRAQVFSIDLNTNLHILGAGTHGRGAWEILTTPVAPPTIAASFGAATIGVNGTTALTFTIANPNSGTSLTGVGFSNTLPAGLIVATPNGVTGSCGGGTITAAAASNSISLSGASLTSVAPSNSCTFSVNVTGTTAGVKSEVTGAVTSNEGGAGSTASASITVVAAPVITLTLSHTGNFTAGQNGATYNLVVANAGTSPTAGLITVTEVAPTGMSLVSIAGTGWTCALAACTRSDALAAGSSYPAITITVNVLLSAALPLVNVVNATGAGAANATASDSTIITPAPSSGLRFIPVTPCRVIDTRNPTGNFGGPIIQGGASRVVPIPQSACNIPATALAYSLNVTVVPSGPLGYLTIWPTGQTQPVVSTLNSFDGRVVANAAIVPAGTSGAISVFVSNPTHVIIDINGYFAPASTANSLSFYPTTPCRIADTRGGFPTGLGAPSIGAGASRSFPIPSSTCGVPAGVQAYSFNITVVPHGPLGYLTVWPSGQPQPVVSTLNAFDGSIVANAAIVPSGTAGAVSVFASDATDVIIDINGYFAAPGSPGAESLYTITPCRIADTRGGFPVGFGTPSLVGGATRAFTIPASTCGLPATAQAYSLNVTVVPPGPLGYLTAWPTGQTQPVVSTLNSPLGKVVANAALVPAGTAGAISVFVTSATDLILDAN